MCIYKHQVCDLTNNCGDFSDEENCDYMKGNGYYKSIGSLLIPLFHTGHESPESP